MPKCALLLFKMIEIAPSHRAFVVQTTNLLIEMIAEVISNLIQSEPLKPVLEQPDFEKESLFANVLGN